MTERHQPLGSRGKRKTPVVSISRAHEHQYYRTGELLQVTSAGRVPVSLRSLDASPSSLRLERFKAFQGARHARYRNQLKPSHRFRVCHRCSYAVGAVSALLALSSAYGFRGVGGASDPLVVCTAVGACPLPAVCQAIGRLAKVSQGPNQPSLLDG